MCDELATARTAQVNAGDVLAVVLQGDDAGDDVRGLAVTEVEGLADLDVRCGHWSSPLLMTYI